MGRRQEPQGNRSSKDPIRVNVSNRQKDLQLSSRSVKKVAEALVLFLKLSCDEVSFFFVSEKKISSLHAQFFDDPTPTDCITFPADTSSSKEESGYLGDCFICPKIAVLYAQKKGLDPYTETLLYIIHTLLHLAGYNDLEVNERRTMRKMEKKCMDHLRNINVQLLP
jgi:probable rRNA maturation factor